MKTFTILKKNRKYFAATTNGYKCKILIDDNSKDLEPGEHTLEVEDISVRSKYGTDLIFKLAAPLDKQSEAGICTLVTPYNKNCIERCKQLGGKWDPEEKAWIFSGLVADQVEELDEKYNSLLIAVEIKTIDYIFGARAPAMIAGYKVATATGRDSGAVIADGVSFIEGQPRSAGSMKNWGTRIDEGCVFRMQIPELCLPDVEEEYEVKKI